MRSKLDRIVVALAVPLFLAGLVAAGGCGGSKGGTIKVGVYGSLTGDDATFGQSTENGVDLAIEEINAAGGDRRQEDRDGRPRTTRARPEEAATAVQKLITQDQRRRGDRRGRLVALARRGARSARTPACR